MAKTATATSRLPETAGPANGITIVATYADGTCSRAHVALDTWLGQLIGGLLHGIGTPAAPAAAGTGPHRNGNAVAMTVADEEEIAPADLEETDDDEEDEESEEELAEAGDTDDEDDDEDDGEDDDDENRDESDEADAEDADTEDREIDLGSYSDADLLGFFKAAKIKVPKEILTALAGKDKAEKKLARARLEELAVDKLDFTSDDDDEEEEDE